MRTTLLLASLFVVACAHTESNRPPRESLKAQAILEPKSGSTVTGQAVFLSVDGAVKLQLDVSNTPPGTHAVHLHVVADCSSDDGESAGPHWNPTNDEHGHLDHGPAHKGDIGNLVVGDDGRGSLTYTTKEWSAATGTMTDVVGHALVLHASPDDFKSQPAGNAGARIACGVVKATGPAPTVVSTPAP